MKKVNDFLKQLKELEKLALKEKEDSLDVENDERYIANLLELKGVFISSIYDLINTNEKYPEIVHILIELLEEKLLKTNVIKEGVIRALTCDEAKGKAEQTLIDFYNSLPTNHKKGNLGWTIGNALEYLYSDDYFYDILKIVRNASNKTSRQMFVLALGKTKAYNDIAVKELLKLTFEEDVQLHAIDALTKLKSVKARNRMKELSKSENKTVQSKAVRYLKKYTPC